LHAFRNPTEGQVAVNPTTLHIIAQTSVLLYWPRHASLNGAERGKQLATRFHHALNAANPWSCGPQRREKTPDGNSGVARPTPIAAGLLMSDQSDRSDRSDQTDRTDRTDPWDQKPGKPNP
jgi:hypothetical protein